MSPPWAACLSWGCTLYSAVSARRITDSLVYRFVSETCFHAPSNATPGCQPGEISPGIEALVRVLFRVPSHHASAFGLSTKNSTCQVSFPLCDMTQRQPLNVSFPTLTTVRPQVFPTSRRFDPPLSLPAYFIRQPHAGFFPFRGFSLRTAPEHSSRPVAPMPLLAKAAHLLLRVPPISSCHGVHPELRGVDPCGDAWIQRAV